MSPTVHDTDEALESFLLGHGEVLPAPRYQEGQVVGPWVITGFLGRGGSAEVYCARRPSDDLVVALKILHRDDPPSRERFELETRLLASLHHPSFPRLHGAGESDGLPYLALELLEPMALPAGDRAIASYLLSVSRGIAVLHRAGYLHRDIKPRNILSRGGRSPVIIDLGLVKDISSGPIRESDRLSIVDGLAVGVGTPGYAAPEQFTSGEATPATDIHALGMLAYECFRQKPPLTWRRIIRRATSTIPGERFQDVDAFIRAIRTRNLPLLAAALLLFLLVAGLFVLATGLGGKGLLRPAAGLGAKGPREFPAELDLAGQEIAWADPVVLRGKGTYRVIGPGRLDARLRSGEGALLWMTNCTVVNREPSGYPTNRLRYELAGDVYLNLAGRGVRPAVPLSVFIRTPDGPERDLDRLDVGPSGNDIRFDGPATWPDLVGRKNADFFEKTRGAIR